MMRLPIAFAAIVVVALAVAAFDAGAQQAAKAYRVGFLSRGTESSAGPLVEAFRAELQALGHVEDKGLTMHWRWANDRVDRLGGMAQDLVRAGVDVIVAPGTVETRAARQVTDRIPIVMVHVGDPVGSGFVRSLARPGGNITGLSFLFPELSAKQLELFIAGLPDVRAIGVLWNPSNPSHPPALQALQRTATALGVELRPVARQGGSFDGTFATLRKSGVKALFVLGEPVVFRHRARLAELAVENGMATMFNLREHAEAGGLMAYGVLFPGLYRRAAVYVDRILKGASPAELPVEQPDKFEFIINLRTAKTLGLVIPDSVLLRADALLQ